MSVHRFLSNYLTAENGADWTGELFCCTQFVNTERQCDMTHSDEQYSSSQSGWDTARFVHPWRIHWMIGCSMVWMSDGWGGCIVACCLGNRNFRKINGEEKKRYCHGYFLWFFFGVEFNIPLILIENNKKNGRQFVSTPIIKISSERFRKDFKYFSTKYNINGIWATKKKYHKRIFSTIKTR